MALATGERVCSGVGVIDADGRAVISGTVSASTLAVPSASGSMLLDRTISAASNNSKNIKATAGQVYGYQFFNINAAVRYVKLYNKATAPTVGTDTPLMTIAVPPGGVSVDYDSGFGIPFSLGIGLGIVTGITDADNTAVAANEIVAHILYK